MLVQPVEGPALYIPCHTYVLYVWVKNIISSYLSYLSFEHRASQLTHNRTNNQVQRATTCCSGGTYRLKYIVGPSIFSPCPPLQRALRRKYILLWDGNISAVSIELSMRVFR